MYGMKITILSVGSKPSTEINKIIQDYLSRLPKHISVEFNYLNHAVGDSKSKIRSESKNILSKLKENSLVILLDENGEQMTSPKLSKKLFSNPMDVIFIIGGAYGVDDEIKTKATFVWSLSKLVYPHQLVRLILAEQIYRAYTIHTNHPYHH